MSKRFITAIIMAASALMATEIATAQEVEKHEVKLLARPLPDSIMLRWAPTTYRLWITGNQYGYLVSRTLVYDRGQTIAGAKPLLLTPTPLKPAALPQWEKMADTQEMAGVAAQAIYGDDFDVDAGTSSSSPVDIFNRASVQESRMGFALLAADQSSQVARLSGLYLVDKTARKDQKYLYKVFPASVPEGMIVDTALFYTGTDEYMPLSAPANLHASTADKMVTLTWDRLGQEGMFSGFYIERSVNDGLAFEPLNSSPLVNTTPEGYDDAPFHYFIDSLENNELQYQYRIYGITPFGEKSPYSAIVDVKGKNQIAIAPIISRIYSPNNKVVRIEWMLTPEIAGKVSGLTLQRSTKFDSGFETIQDSILPSANFTIDNSPLLTGYYRMLAFNSDGRGPAGMPRMVQIVDSIPPAAPTGITAVADTTGKVWIRWLANREADIYGYRIFRANSSNEEFAQLTPKPVADTLFIDHIELRTLTKEVYYRVVAIDKRQNRSDFSAIYELERPDIVPPASPAIRSILANDKGIDLKWFPSNSSDVVEQYLYRNSGENPQWTLIAKLMPTASAYSDTLLTPALYRYLLVAADKAGNESHPTKPVAAKYTIPVKEGEWITPKVKVDKKKGLIMLSWESQASKSAFVLLYGKNSRGEWRFFKKISNTGFTSIECSGEFIDFVLK